MCTISILYLYILYHVLVFRSPKNNFNSILHSISFTLHCTVLFQILFCFAQTNDHMSPSRRNESTGEEDYVGAGTLLDTDVVATTATKVYNQEDQM